MPENSNENKRTALVTGANKGIGYEIAAGLARLGFRVGGGAPGAGPRADAVDKLRADGLDVFGVPLDVTDDVSVAAAAAQLQARGGLDVLVNNAAITGGMPQDPSKVSAEQVLSVVDTNVVGVIRVTNAVLPMLRRATSPRIVNVSSTVGSLTLQTAQAAAVGPVSAVYSPTKSYLNAVTVQYAKELAGTGILVNAGCPGFVATDLNGHQGTRTPEQGAAVFLALATLPDGGPTGTFRDEDGIQPW
ncbi:SDR family NAD(P)-dependent oxidoreductase [Mumia sp.]|uniref:SDR family NAD(P)-dependent oxidoreductase n=1 Tax=Mumia sp. TaxID=1965300 RepID=UPI0026019325|nr:SDR family NAD(P)-dependent oxidoreductase [Mumia sp.]MDD9347244.1 SDR family NAD(P)-dependent oxidoreductase [Mumia sp.]